jgi:hypothetical protein
VTRPVGFVTALAGALALQLTTLSSWQRCAFASPQGAATSARHDDHATDMAGGTGNPGDAADRSGDCDRVAQHECPPAGVPASCVTMVGCAPTVAVPLAALIELGTSRAEAPIARPIALPHDPTLTPDSPPPRS